MGRVRDRLLEPIDAASLGAFRVMFGALMLWEVARYFAHGWIHRYYLEPHFHFRYLFFEWVRPPPAALLYVVFGALGALSACVALGVLHRAAAIGLFVGTSYVFLLEQARYLNHFYLVCLVCLLLCVVQADRWGALRWRRAEPETVPAWNLLLLRAQMFLVYFYAGVAKLDPDWLRGEPVRTWLARRAGLPTVGPLLASEPAVWIVAYGGLLFDLSIGFLLAFRRTRGPALVVAVLFHLSNAALFHIGVFPWMAIALTLLFLEPGWPRRTLRAIRTRGPARWRPVEIEPEPGGGDRAPDGDRRGRETLSLALVAAYLLVQVLVPLRHWLYPGHVSWTEEGHRFSWRMKLRSKVARLRFEVRDPATGRSWVVRPADHLAPFQARALGAGHPDMVLQFARHARDVIRSREAVEHPEVRVEVRASLNSGRRRLLVDPRVDLASQPRTLGHSSWILGGAAGGRRSRERR